MKLALLTLLLLLCSTQVLTLKCFTCENDDCEMNSKSEMECPSSDREQWCKTVEQAGVITSRGCSFSCDQDDFTSCCQEDLC